MKKVFVRAYIKGNLGDDLFILILCERYPSISFVICGESRYERCFDSISNLGYFRTDSFLHKWIIRAFKLPARLLNIIAGKRILHEIEWEDLFIKICKLNILISGSCFMENNGEFAFDADKKNEIRYFKTNPVVIGTNFGPFHSEEFRTFYKKCFELCEYVCFREKNSFELFRLNNMKYGADIVFLLDDGKETIYEYTEKSVVVSIVNIKKEETFLRGRFSDVPVDELQYLYERKMTDLLQLMLTKGEKITLLGACDYEGDDKAIESILSGISEECIQNSITVVNYPRDPLSVVLGCIKNAKAVIGGRYHSMILGWLFDKSVYPVCYSMKMKHIIDEYSPLSKYTMIYDIDDLSVDDVYDAILSSNKAYLDVDKIKNSANTHFEYTDILLKNKKWWVR